MDIQKLSDYISFKKTPVSWENRKEEIEKSYRRDWLDAFKFDEAIEYFGYSDVFKEKFFKVLADVKKDDYLDLACYYMYYIIYFVEGDDYFDAWNWDFKLPTEHADPFMTTIPVLCGYDIFVENMKKRNYDEDEFLRQKKVVWSCNKETAADAQRTSMMMWTSRFIRAEIIYAGRLQYEVDKRKPAKCIRHLIPEENVMIHIHIPSGKNLDDAEVEESFKLADKLLRKYFPEFSGKEFSYSTGTWLLCPELREYLGESSNIAKFQDRFEIAPANDCKQDLRIYLFHDPGFKLSIEELPENSSLQRNVKKALLEGKVFHKGLGVIKKK